MKASKFAFEINWPLTEPEKFKIPTDLKIRLVLGPKNGPQKSYDLTQTQHLICWNYIVTTFSGLVKSLKPSNLQLCQ